MTKSPLAASAAPRNSPNQLEKELNDMNIAKTFSVLAFGSVLLAGCGANKNEPAAQTGPASPAVETPAPLPEDMTTPADSTDTVPAGEPDPVISDTLPPGQQPPPSEPAPPPGG